MTAAPWPLPQMSCQGTQGPAAAAGELCPAAQGTQPASLCSWGWKHPRHNHTIVRIKRDLLEIGYICQGRVTQ